MRIVKELHFDFIEINSKVLKELKRLPAGVNYLFRIRNLEDARACIESSIKYCCIDEILSFDLDLLVELYDNGIDIMVEMRLDRRKAIKNLISVGCKVLFIKSIRVVGMNGIEEIEWISKSVEEIVLNQKSLHRMNCSIGQNLLLVQEKKESESVGWILSCLFMKMVE